MEYQCCIWQIVPHFLNLIFKNFYKKGENKPRCMGTMVLTHHDGLNIIQETVLINDIKIGPVVLDKKFFKVFSVNIWGK